MAALLACLSAGIQTCCENSPDIFRKCEFDPKVRSASSRYALTAKKINSQPLCCLNVRRIKTRYLKDMGRLTKSPESQMQCSNYVHATVAYRIKSTPVPTATSQKSTDLICSLVYA